jgi:hypothetical protein
VQRHSATHCDYRRAPVPPTKSKNSSPFTEGGERVSLQHNKNPERDNIISIPLLLDLQEKELKTPSTEAQGIKTLTKTNSRCVNLNAE